jgi:hypothetical protein
LEMVAAAGMLLFHRQDIRYSYVHAHPPKTQKFPLYSISKSPVVFNHKFAKISYRFFGCFIYILPRIV